MENGSHARLSKLDRAHTVCGDRLVETTPEVNREVAESAMLLSQGARRAIEMMREADPEYVGDDSVVIGTGVPRHVGNRSVVIGATDARGNTRLEGGTALGYNAHADSTSVAAGAHAGAGGIIAQLTQLQALLLTVGEFEPAEATADLLQELQAPNPDPSRIKRLWGRVETVASAGATASGVLVLVHQLSPLIASII